MYDQFDDIQTIMLSLVSEDEAAILSASQAEITVIPQRVFMQEDVLLEVLLSGLTVETVSNLIILRSLALAIPTIHTYLTVPPPPKLFSYSSILHVFYYMYIPNLLSFQKFIGICA